MPPLKMTSRLWFRRQQRAGFGGEAGAGWLSMAIRTAPRMPVSLYQELINQPTASVSKVTAQLQLAELYQASNQPLDAKRLYEQIKKDNPSPEAVTDRDPEAGGTEVRLNSWPESLAKISAAHRTLLPAYFRKANPDFSSELQLRLKEN
jgi:hypothetical protein